MLNRRWAVLVTIGAALSQGGCALLHPEADPHVKYQRDQWAESAIKRVLTAQAEAWNRGDIDGYMAGYWKSDGLTFSAGGKTTRGWQATYDHYKAKYPTATEMGRLEFGELEVHLLSGGNAAYVLGRWRIERAQPIGGNFTLVMSDLGDEGWRIVHDHTSVDPEAGGSAP